jgi:hypothetical protein
MWFGIIDMITISNETLRVFQILAAQFCSDRERSKCKVEYMYLKIYSPRFSRKR